MFLFKFNMFFSTELKATIYKRVEEFNDFVNIMYA